MVGIYGMFCSFGLVGRCALVLVLGAALGLGWALGGAVGGESGDDGFVAVGRGCGWSWG